MKNRVMSLVLAFCMVLSCVVTIPMNVSAFASGTCGDNLTWTLDDNGTLTISGTGKIMVWDNLSDIKPLFDACTVKI